MPLTTPEQQRAAAEAARAEGDKNPKTDPKEEISALEKQIVELKEKQKVLKPALSETLGPTLTKPEPVVPTSKLASQTVAPNVPSTTTSP